MEHGVRFSPRQFFFFTKDGSTCLCEHIILFIKANNNIITESQFIHWKPYLEFSKYQKLQISTIMIDKKLDELYKNTSSPDKKNMLRIQQFSLRNTRSYKQAHKCVWFTCSKYLNTSILIRQIKLALTFMHSHQ